MIELGTYVEEKVKELKDEGYEMTCYVTFRMTKGKYSIRREFLPEDAPKLDMDWRQVVDYQIEAMKSELEKKKDLYS